MSVAKISTKIINYFHTKFPETYQLSGFKDKDIETLVGRIYASDGDKKQKVNNLISVLERKINEKIYSENRQRRVVNTNQYTMDPEVDVKYSTYVDKPFSAEPSIDISNNATNYAKLFEIDPESVLNSAGVEKTNLLRTQFKDPMEPEERPFVYNIIIDSKDRDRVKYPNPASFVIDFSPPESQGGSVGDINKGYISTAFGNIISCELLDITLLDTSVECDSSDSAGSGNIFPYIILDLPELGTNYYGTNDELNRSFATLTTYETHNGYKHYNINAINSNQTITKVYNPRINLNRLSIRLKLPDGTLYSFGSVNNSATETVFKLSFRITTLQKNLATSFINKALY
jgi:hypothetical protein